MLSLHFVKVFRKDQSLVLSYSYSTLLLSVLLCLIRMLVSIYLLTTLKCSSPSGRLNSPSIFYTYKIQLILSLNGCLIIFCHSINPRSCYPTPKCGCFRFECATRIFPLPVWSHCILVFPKESRSTQT